MNGDRRVMADRELLRPALVVVGCLIVALVGGGLFFQHKAKSAADVESARTDAAAVGAQVVGKLFSYDYRTLSEVLPDRLPMLTSDFAAKYRTMVLTNVRPAARRQKVTTRTDVVTTSVISGDRDSVTLLMFLNQTSAQGKSQTPVLAGSRVEVVMTRDGDSWKVASVDPV